MNRAGLFLAEPKLVGVLLDKHVSCYVVVKKSLGIVKATCHLSMMAMSSVWLSTLIKEVIWPRIVVSVSHVWNAVRQSGWQFARL